MTFVNGGPADEGELVRSGHDDVVIEIRGVTAAKLLGRAEIGKQISTELTSLAERIAALEAGSVQRAAQQAALSQAVEGLRDKVGQLGAQLADLSAEVRNELGKLRSDLDAHSMRAASLPMQIEQRVRSQIDTLQRGLIPLERHISDLQLQVGSVGSSVSELDSKAASLTKRLDEHIAETWRARLSRWRQPDKAAANGEAPADMTWLKRLHFW